MAVTILRQDNRLSPRTFCKLRKLALVALSVAFTACSDEQPEASAPAPEVDKPAMREQGVVVYSSLNPAQVTPVLEAYSAETGVKTELVSDDYDGLMRRLSAHGGDPVADLLISGNVASLANAAENNLLRPIYTDALQAGIPAALSDPDRYWFPLSIHARVVIYNSSLVSEDEVATITNYQSLANENWRGRLCMASSKHAGSRTLIAQLIRAQGKRDAELTVRGWTRNFVEAFYKDDSELLRALIDADCAVTIADTRTLIRFKSADPALPLVALSLSDGARPQIDISGAGVTRHARNPDGAEALLNWLLTVDANALFAASGAETPVNSDAVVDVAVEKMATFIAEPDPVVELGLGQEEARLLAERARYP